MNIIEFGNIIKEEVKNRLGEGYTVDYTQVTKNNGVMYHALLIRKTDSNIAPTIYIDGFYNEYSNGSAICTVVDEVMEVYRNCLPPDDMDVDFFFDFSTVSKRLTFKVVNKKRNENLLMDIPYREFEDLAFVPLCLVSCERIGDGCITIKKEHLNKWEISEEELWENVYENAAKLTPIDCQSILETLSKGFMKGDDPGLYGELSSIFVVSNKQNSLGASAVFYPGVLDELSAKLGGDLVILPSSVHETIVMAAPSDKNALARLTWMVKEVNRSVVSNTEILSDNAYFYEAETKKISVITE
ncbi:DUF5688 family protein [Butyrivibrio sp. YAB3001]|uniref:DUF5688 family protein n=1 Tax=Butyrivibrio sp. YAB3001 TaxID=1520812 RepID=UPI0008F64F3B|nr:DUF5688 family protein [Butyrivibrio sp. YAB3001]SFB83690.1 hypothetical protein SAMN02910398_00812 [Butyrivibrio sp. YAB3001]